MRVGFIVSTAFISAIVSGSLAGLGPLYVRALGSEATHLIGKLRLISTSFTFLRVAS